jgi:MFS transporter, DHA1 family, multidrug resistance protein
MTGRTVAWKTILDRRLLLLLLLQFGSGIIVSPATTLLPVYLSDIGYSAVFIAGAFTLQRLVSLISSLAGGTLSDLLSRKQTIVLGQVGLLAASVVFLARSPATILLLWALYGVGQTLNSLGSQSYLMDNAGSRSLGLLTAFYYWGSTLGGGIGSQAAALLLTGLAFGGFGVVFCALGVGTFALAVIALPPSKRDRTARAAKDAGKLFGFREIASRPAVLLLALLRFLPTFCYGILTVYVPLLLMRDGATTPAIAIYATVSSLTAALVQLVAGRLADRAGPRFPALAAFALLALSALGIGLFHDQLEAVFIFGVLCIAAAWSLSVMVPSMVALVTKATERGRVLGFIQLFWNLGMIMGSLAGGFLFEIWTGLPFMVGGVAVLMASFLLMVFFRVISARQAATE